MSTMTADRAAAINARSAARAAQMRDEADKFEAAGPADEIITGSMTRAEIVAANRALADSLERAASHAKAGARIGRA